MRKRSYVRMFVCSYVLMFLCGVILAEEKVAAAAAVVLNPGAAEFFTKSVMIASLGLVAMGIVGAAMQMFAIRKALEGMARQPEAGGQLQLSMIIGLAFIESLVLYVLFISIILLFANPFTKYFIQ
ncbi:MAG: ATP synthase F0 subunit C [Elusimicrobiota bacterium]|nr:ATP synthase F0 subunit C [Elusimicrobiota bacterium]